MKPKNVILIFVLILGILTAILFTTSKKEPIKKENGTEQTEERMLTPQAGLPEAVEEKRQEIFKATLSRDYGILASKASYPFSYSFGGEYESGFAGYLELSEKTENRSAFDIIPSILNQPYYKANYGQKNIYVWPEVFGKSSDQWTEEDLVNMKKFLSEEKIESYREFGGYLDYRIGISEQGEWLFYIAGD